MDVASTIVNIGGGIDEERARLKLQSLRHAFANCADHKISMTFEEFFRRIPKELLVTTFGSEAEDAHFTALFAGLSANGVVFDPVISAVLNHLVLELTYQTRFLTTGGVADVFILDGYPEIFPICMAHGNVAFGISLRGKPAKLYELPEWALKYTPLELRPEYLADSHVSELGLVLDINSRPKVGCLAISLPLTAKNDVPLGERFDVIRDRVSPFTTYALFGPAELVLDAVAQLDRNHPEARTFTKLYVRPDHEYEPLAISVSVGLDHIPDLILRAKRELDCTFVNARGEDGQLYEGLVPIMYHEWEKGGTKKPFAVSASAPLPDEIRNQTARIVDVYHQVVSVRGGMLVPYMTPDASTYIHVSAHGQVIMDYGNEVTATHRTQLWKDSRIDADGQQRSKLKLKNVLKVPGTAMPLLFTPNLYQWFSHFVIQCLPRVLILRDLGLVNTKILVPIGLRRKQLEMLILAGVREEDIIKVPDGVVAQADELIVPRAWPLIFTPYTMSIYNEFVAKQGFKSSVPTRRILISREIRKTWRNLLNFDAVKQLLVDEFGFEIVRPETLTLKEEIEIFYQSQLVIGAEGAGLYAGCYAQPQSAYISISDEDYAMPILGSIAAIRGFNLGYIFGESMRSDRDLVRRLPYGHTDFVVNPARVGYMVEAALEVLA